MANQSKEELQRLTKSDATARVPTALKKQNIDKAQHEAFSKSCQGSSNSNTNKSHQAPVALRDVPDLSAYKKNDYNVAEPKAPNNLTGPGASSHSSGKGNVPEPSENSAFDLLKVQGKFTETGDNFFNHLCLWLSNCCEKVAHLKNCSLAANEKEPFMRQELKEVIRRVF